MRILLLGALVAVACGDDTGGPAVVDASVPDAGPVSYAPSNLSEDDFLATVGNLEVDSGETIVLSSDTLMVEMHTLGVGAPRVQEQADDSQIAVFRYARIQIDGTLEIVGTRVVALVAAGDVSIAGDIVFPDGAALTCGLVTTGVVPGGGGGGHGSAGGTGGNSGGAPGPVRGADTLVPLVAGCAGGPGVGQATAEGGFGGGAIQISAGGSISVAGTICASGGGGESVAASGGGGGGSGGAILLEARDMAISSGGGLIAHGGGGGGGGAANTAGEAGQVSCAAAPATGGPAGGALGGAGGGGGFGAGPGGNGDSGVNPSADAGGGAGGGVGRIRLNSVGGVVATDAGEFSGTVTQGSLVLE